jgi:hypothetical protein
MVWSPRKQSHRGYVSVGVAEATLVIASLRMPRVGVRLFVGDILLDESEEMIIEARILNCFPPHDAKDFGGARRHRNRCGSDSRARRLLHLLEPAVLSAGGNEYDARSVTIIGARGLQTYGDVQLRVRLVVPRPGQDAGFVRTIHHVTLAEQRPLDAPAHRIARSGQGPLNGAAALKVSRVASCLPEAHPTTRAAAVSNGTQWRMEISIAVRRI